MYRNLERSKGIKGFDESFISTTDMINDLIYIDGRVIYPFKLKAGKYEFFRWTLPEAGYYQKSMNHFSIQFDVVAGRVNYIGNIVMIAEGGLYSLNVRDGSDVDVPVFLEEYKNVPNDNVFTNVATFSGFK